MSSRGYKKRKCRARDTPIFGGTDAPNSTSRDVKLTCLQVRPDMINASKISYSRNNISSNRNASSSDPVLRGPGVAAKRGIIAVAEGRWTGGRNGLGEGKGRRGL